MAQECKAQKTQFQTRLREERSFRLQACDYVFISDYVSTLSEEKLNEWKVYRQALRDITIDAHPQLDETGMTLTGVEYIQHPLIKKYLRR